MIVAAYNVLKGGARGAPWLRLIDQHGVDLLLAQESFPADRQLTPEVGGLSAWEPASRNKWGSAIWSKRGELRPIAVPEFAGWVVGAEIERDEGRFLAFSLHAPFAAGSYVKAVDLILDAIAKVAAGREVLIGGDFNIGLNPRPDGSRPLNKRELAIQDRLADEFGLFNCWREANPGAVPPQTLRWTRNPTTPYHCDGLYAPRAWRERLRGCSVLSGPDWNALSDHNPILARFDDP